MEGEECNTNLALSIGGSGGFRADKRHESKEKPPTQLHVLFPLQEEEEGQEEELAIRKHRSISSPDNIGEVVVLDANLARDHNVGGRRKKLRLSKEQVALLEDSFTEHNTLNSKQKQVLARKLNIQARQVEVWFQNRRARTKLKKTEVDYESLKKCCEKLCEENQRLKEEIEELRRRQQDLPLYIHHPPKATTPTMCPSCGRRADATGGNGRSKDAFRVKKEQENWSLCIMG